MARSIPLMLITVAEFRQRVLGSQLDGFIRELEEKTGRSGVEERRAWKESLTLLAHRFDHAALAQLHLYLGDVGNLAVEYRLPAASSWCDVVLLGHNGQQPSAVILELKHWDTSADVAVPYSGLIRRPRGLTLHPSEQVKGYSEYCRQFHSVVHETRAAVNGCVLFTARSVNPVYRTGVHEALVKEFPCFGLATNAEAAEALEYLNLRLVRPDAEFAQQFERGHYRQDRSFIRAVGDTLRGSRHRRLQLLDEQRTGLFTALAAVEEAIDENRHNHKKRVVIIEGPPGSGKSAVAAQLWAELAAKPDLPEGNLAFVTTGSAQDQNVTHLFGAGAGAVKKASSFSPTSQPEFNALRRRYPDDFVDYKDWRNNLGRLRKRRGPLTPPDDFYLVSIADEAHALVNSESSDSTGPRGFPLHWGPLGYHIIRSSVVSVFLMDGEQSFREWETTNKQQLLEWAAELGAEVMPIVSLAERQFRCGGSTEYIRWVDHLLANEPAESLAQLAHFWRDLDQPVEADHEAPLSLAAEDPSPYKVVLFPKPHRQFRFEMVDSPAALDAALTRRSEEGRSVRLVSSYARKWVTKNDPSPHDRPKSDYDFQIEWTNESGKHIWQRLWNWNLAPQGYVSWIDPAPGVPMAANPLVEVGCPYTVRGFDFDYLGILWLDDVVWREDHWEVVPANVQETGLTRHRGRAKKEKDPLGPHHQVLLAQLLRGYRILLSRSLKGVYLWCQDLETRRHIESCLFP